MGTNMYQKYGNSDGGTTFWFYDDGSPTYDFTDYDSTSRDGMHGMRLFAESRGYTVTTNYNQYIYGYNGNTQGFTYAQYKAEIDAGYPVLIQLNGHTMLGVGYSGTDQVIVHNTWDYSSHTMNLGRILLRNASVRCWCYSPCTKIGSKILWCSGCQGISSDYPFS